MTPPVPFRPMRTRERVEDPTLYDTVQAVVDANRWHPIRRSRILADRATEAMLERDMLAEEVIRLKRRLEGFKSSPPIVIAKLPSLPMSAAMQMRDRLPLDHRLGILTRPEHLQGIGPDVEVHQFFGRRLVGADPADRRMSEYIRDRFNNVTYWESDDVVLEGKLEPAQVVTR